MVSQIIGTPGAPMGDKQGTAISGVGLQFRVTRKSIESHGDMNKGGFTQT